MCEFCVNKCVKFNIKIMCVCLSKTKKGTGMTRRHRDKTKEKCASRYKNHCSRMFLMAVIKRHASVSKEVHVSPVCMWFLLNSFLNNVLWHENVLKFIPFYSLKRTYKNIHTVSLIDLLSCYTKMNKLINLNVILTPTVYEIKVK